MKKTIQYLKTHFLKSLAIVCALAFAAQLSAQNWPGAPGGGAPSGKGGPAQMNIGRFYGKVVDENKKGVGYATVELFGMSFDSVAKTMKEKLITGQITEENGDFSLEKLPVMGEFTMKISFIGYTEVTQKVSFGLAPPKGAAPGGGAPAGGMPGGGMPGGGGFPMGGGSFEKDLGNIKLVTSATDLKEVTVTAQAAQTTLALDKKVYRVDKDASTAGGNAQDALKNVPSLSVDLDGNVSLRNGAPQIFVDGRPTTLSLDQISADAIESVEVITNPSAKFDAGGGTAGIINIVLKKEKRLGYNGNVRAGTDTRTGYNAGGDVNARGEKTNMFISGNFNRNKGYSDGETYRDNFPSPNAPRVYSTQLIDNTMEGYFANARAGFDWFADNRNTVTLSGSLTRGPFEPKDELTVLADTFASDNTSILNTNSYVRNTLQDRNFRNLGASAQFKHLFPKEGAEWTADVNYNRMKFFGNSNYETLYEGGVDSKERQKGEGSGSFITVQTDFVNPLNKQMKLEGGLRGSMRNNKNDNSNFYTDPNTGQEVQVTSLADH
ncbi:MAG: outer membrane beta-barrel protein, partial [Saprospiraceae bacterium]|nr:outer membrane beta-barrel protein [Saprospiraceae bacterium]